MQLRLTRYSPLAAAIICMLALTQSVASAATITIDEFDAPAPADVQAIGILPGQPGPRLLVKQDMVDAIGGERDALFEVMGTVTPGVYTGYLGNGIFYYNGGTRTGTKATLQYDGLDADDPGTPSLIDAQGLGPVNLGLAGKLTFGFLSTDAGPSQNTFQLEIKAVSTGGTASFLGNVGESAVAFDYDVDYASFTATPGFSFAEIKSLTICFNKSALPAVDFELDRITVTVVPEPSSLVLLICGGGISCWYGWNRRRKPLGVKPA